MKRLIVLAFLFLCAYVVKAQEICNNGVDDDNDGFIDCFDKDCTNSSLCDGYYLGNDVICQAKPTSFPSFSMKLKWSSPNKTTNHLNRASVGDLNRDGVPEVLVTEIESNAINILDGETGAIKKTLKVTYQIDREVVIGNLNNDACGEVFVSGEVSTKVGKKTVKTLHIFAYDCNLNLLWTSTALSAPAMMFGLADFDGDGKVEIFSRDEILDAHTGVRIVKGTDSYNTVGAPVAVDILNNDNKLELVAGCKIFEVTLGARTLDVGSLVLKRSVPSFFIRKSHSSTSVADYNLDGSLDVIASGSDGSEDANTTIFFWDVKTDVVKKYIDKIAGDILIAGCSNTTGKYYENGWQNGTGRVNIADIDGDGKLNASYVSGKYLYALKEDFTLKWRVSVNEETSGYTGCSVYDFNGDGAAEVVYRDERYLYIINGKDGSVNTQQQCIARTAVEYPIVADIDGDGSTELCVTCGFDDKLAWDNFCTLSYSENSHVRVFESASLPWVPSRKLWNQHAYFNVNVNDDLTIPKIQQKHHLVFSTGTCTQGPNRPLNTFLNQTPYLDTNGCPTYASPDLVNVAALFKIQPPTCPGNDFTVTVGVRNQGDVSIAGDVPITFYNGDPTKVGAVKLNTVTIPVNLATNQTGTFTNLKVTGTGGSFKLFISLNDAGTSLPTPIKLPNTTFLECNYDNVISADVVPKSVKLTALKVNDNVKCIGSTVPDNGAARAFISVAGVENTTDYDFFWYNGPVVGAHNFKGAVYSGLAAGTYRVFARHKTALCNSDTATVVINRVDKPMTASIVVDKPNTSCSIPNGEMHAVVNGGDPVINFTFKWYEGNDIFTSPEVGVGSIAKNLKGGKTYTVLVTDIASGCQAVASLPVPDNTTAPTLTTSKVDAVCVPVNSGSASATVGGVTTGFTFRWYNGTATKPAADFTGAAYNSIPAGSYTVTAENTTTGCVSAPTTVVVGLPPSFAVTASMVAQQTSCLTPNGSATANVGGVTAGFTFDWFSGQTTAAGNAISGPTGLASGTYTVRATQTSTGCTDTEEVTITQSQIFPVVTLTPSPNTTCSTTLGTSAFNGAVTGTVTYNGVAVTDFTNYQLTWHNGALVTDPTIAGATTPNLSQLNGGSYTLEVKRTDLGCAAAPVTAVVTNTLTLPVLTTSQTPSHNCVAGKEDGIAEVTQVNGTAVGSTTNFNYQWHTGTTTATPIASATNAKLQNVQGGATSNYTVLVTNKTTGCQNTATVLVADDKAVPTVTLAAQNNTICDPSLTSPAKTFNGKVTATVTNQVGALSDYTFAFGGGNTTTPVALQSANIFDRLNGGATAYTVVATHTVTGCVSAQASAPVANVQDLPDLITSSTSSTNCVVGSEDGQARVVSVDGTAVGLATGYTYSWAGPTTPAFPVTTGTNNSNTSQLIKVQGGAGYAYTVTVTNQANGCQATSAVNVGEAKVLPVITLAAINNGICDPAKTLPAKTFSGRVTATVTNQIGALSNYTFAFGGGNTAPPTAVQTANVFDQLNGGPVSYTATATHTPTGCVSAQVSIPVANVQDLPDLITSSTSSTNCVVAKEDGQARVVSVDGIPVASASGFTYTWTGPASFPVTVAANGSNTFQLTKLQGGTGYDYTVVVLNQTNGCEATTPVTVGDARVLPVVTLAATPNGICDPAKTSPAKVFSGRVTATVTNQIGALSDYTFAFGGGNTSGIQTLNIFDQLNDGPTPYTVVATHTPTGCVSPQVSMPVTSNRDLPDLQTASTASTNCVAGKEDGQARVTFVDGTAVGSAIGYTYAWTGPAAFPTLTIGTNASNTSQLVKVQGGAGFDYTVLVTNQNNGCEGTALVNVGDSKALPTLTLAATDNHICDATRSNTGQFDGTATATISTTGNYASSVNGDFTFTWTTPGPATVAGVGVNQLLNRDDGTYTLKVLHTNTGCESISYNTQIVDATVVPNLTMSQTAARNCTTLNDGKATVTVNSPVGQNYDYNWFNGTSVTATPDNSTSNTTTLTNTYNNVKGGLDPSSGVSLFQYTVEVLVKQTGCAGTQTVSVDADGQAPVITMAAPTPNTNCSATKNGAAALNTLSYRGSAVAAPYTGFTFNWTGTSPGTVGPAPGNTYTALPAGTYNLTVTNTADQCTSNQLSVIVVDNLYLPLIAIDDSNHQTSCDPATPNGSVSASIDETAIGGGAAVTAGYTFTWDWTDGTPQTSTANPVTNLKGNKTYSVTAVRTATGCSGTQSAFLKETLTIPTVTTVPTHFIVCSPPSGAVTASALPASTYTFFWADGSSAASEAAVVAANNTGLTGTVAANIYSALNPGEYTVVARDNTTKCVSSQVVTVVNNNSVTPNPVIENTTIPGSCATNVGVLTAGVRTTALTDFTGVAATDELTIPASIGLAVNDKIIIQRKGTAALPTGLLEDQTYFVETINGAGTVITLKDGGGVHINLTVDGSGSLANFVTAGFTFNWYDGVPSGVVATDPIDYFSNLPNFAALTASEDNPNSVNDGLITGLYTVEVENNVTKCKSFVSHTLPFVGSHAVIRIGKTNSLVCNPPNADNGSITLRIEDPAGAPPAPTYDVFLRSGVTVLATVPGAVQLTDYTISSALSPGTYTVEVRQNYAPNCPLFEDVVIGRDAFAPVVSLASALTPNSACTPASFDGRIDLTVAKDASQPAGLNPTYNIVMNPDPNGYSAAHNGVAVGTHAATGLGPNTYTFTVTASTGCATTKSFTILDNPVVAHFLLADINITPAAYCDETLEASAQVVVTQLELNGTPGAVPIDDYDFVWRDVSTNSVVVPSTRGDAAASTGGDEFLNTVPGTVLSKQYSIVATKNHGTAVGRGCATPPFVVNVTKSTVDPVITLTPTVDTSCAGTPEGTITVDVTTSAGPGMAGPYAYDWTPSGAAGQPTDTPGGGPFMPGTSDLYSNIKDGSYSLKATNTVTGCFGNQSTTVSKGSPPLFTVAATPTDLTNCVSPGFPFNGLINGISVSATVASAPIPVAVTDFDYVWFKTNLATKVLDGLNAGVPDDTQLTTTTLPAISTGSYFVKAVRKAGGTGSGCESAPVRIDILDKTLLPQVEVATTPNSTCSPAQSDGSITVKGGTTGFGAGTNYQFDFPTLPGTASIAGLPSTQASVAPVAPSLLSLATFATPVSDQIPNGSYSVKVTNQSNGCATTTTFDVQKITVPIAVTSTSTPLTHCVTPDGTVTTAVTVGGAAAPSVEFSYVWTGTGATTANLTGLSAGTYTVVATKTSIATNKTAFGCSSAVRTQVVNDARVAPTISTSTTGNSTCSLAQADGAFTITAGTTGFAAGTSYQFTFPVVPGTATIAGLPATVASIAPVAPSVLSLASFSTAAADRIPDGNYSVTATNQTNGCLTTVAFAVPKRSVPIVASTSSTPLTHCVTPDGSVSLAGITVGGAAANVTEFSYVWTGTPATTATVSNLAAGSYSITVTKNSVATNRTSFGCSSAPSTVAILDQRTDPSVSITSVANTTCTTAASDGAITITAGTTGFGAGTSYVFGFNTTPAFATIAGLPATRASVAAVAPSTLSLATFSTLSTDDVPDGAYTVTVTNQTNGCDTDASVQVQKTTVPMQVFTASTPVTVCPGLILPNGSVQVTSINLNNVSMALSQFNLTWSGSGATTTSVSNQAVGSYTVTAIKNNSVNKTASGCQATGAVTVIDDHENPTVSSSIQENTACDTNFDGRITLNMSNLRAPGAGANYDINWTVPVGHSIAAATNVGSPFTTPTTDVIGAGTFVARVTNRTTQCFTDATVTMVTNPQPLAVLTVSSTDQDICNPDGSITVTTLNSGTPANYSFEWFRSSMSSSALTDATATQISASLLTAGNGAGQYPTMGAGTYFVRGTKVAGANPGSGCSTAPFRVDIKDIHVDPVIPAATVNPDVFCAGGAGAGSITLLASSPLNFTYSWFAGNDITGTPVTSVSGVNGEIAQNLQEGAYTVQVRETATNCTSISHYTIANNPLIAAFDATGFAAPAITSCDITSGQPLNGSATVSSIRENGAAQPLTNYTFQWTNNASAVLQTGASPILNNIPAGTYFVRATHGISNCVAQLEFEIEDQTIGSTTVTLVDFDEPERCVDPKVGYMTVLGGGNGASYSYEWFAGDQRPTPSGTPVAVGATLNSITVPTGQTDVTFTVKTINDTNNCWAVDAFDVPLIVNPVILNASANPLTFCTSDNGEVFATIVNDNKFEYDFGWSNGATAKATPDFTGNNVGNLAAGTYTVVATDRADTGCVSPSVTVVIDNMQVIPVVSAGVLKALTICDPARPDGVAAADVGGDITRYTFDWFAGAAATGTPFYRGAEVGSLSASTFSVLATETLTGCSASASVVVPTNFAAIPKPTIVVVSNITSCLVDNGELSASVDGVTKDYIFDWANGTTAPPPIAFTGEFYKDLSVGQYTVIATSRITGCVSPPATAPIIKDQTIPDFDFLVQNASCSLANGFITLLFDNDVSIDKVTWSQNGSLVAEGPNLENAFAGFYDVTVQTTLGCENTKEVELPVDILVYNGVSRTEDGKNDIFLIECIENFPNNHVEIFNRAGTKVYEADGYNNTDILFDGKSNKGISLMGTTLPAGTYFYVISKGDGSERIVGYLELVD